MTSFAKTRAVVAAWVVPALLAAVPAHAGACWTERTTPAAQVRQLDVMLMVGSLRCRTGADDYRASYDSFLSRHRDHLGQANHALLDDMAQRMGALGAMEALDRASVRMANHYGVTGTYGCHELKLVTAALANGSDAEIDHAADVLVGPELEDGNCPVTLAAASAAAVVPAGARR